MVEGIYFLCQKGEAVLSWVRLRIFIYLFLAPTGAQGVKMLSVRVCVRACVRPGHYAQESSRKVLEGAKESSKQASRQAGR